MILAQESAVKFDPFAEEHDHLQHTILDLRQILAERHAPQEAVVELFTEFTESVRAHFVHEELEDGFFESVVDQAPWLKHEADALIDEHRDLAAQLAQLQWHAERGVPSDTWWRTIHSRFEAFCLLFSRHETQENRLLQTAFNQDIGAED